MNDTKQEEDALTRIRECVSQWISARPQARSITKLASLTGYSREKMSRTLSNETKLDFSVAAAILSITTSDDTARRILDEFWPKESVLLRRLNFGCQPESKSDIDDDVFRCDPMTLEIYFLATRDNGISENEIKNEFGRFGEASIKRMIEGNVLKFIGNRYLAQPWQLNTPRERVAFCKSLSEIAESKSLSKKAPDKGLMNLIA